MLENKIITHRYRTKNAFIFQMVKVVQIIGILVGKVENDLVSSSQGTR